MVGPYALKRKLGKGANGEVRLAIHRLTGLKKAIKIIPKGDVADCSKLDTEIKAMMMLQHKHIVQLEEVLESRDHVFFVMEICGGGNLYDYLDHQPLSEALARYYLRQIVSGVGYCHEMGIVHRDLSLMNLLLDNNANIKISDFGCAGIFQRGMQRTVVILPVLTFSSRLGHLPNPSRWRIEPRSSRANHWYRLLWREDGYLVNWNHPLQFPLR
jgi:5'-AMP-activated protein kinase catalytic alpha subunit